MQNRTMENALHTEAVSVWMSAVCVYFSIVGHGETAQGICTLENSSTGSLVSAFLSQMWGWVRRGTFTQQNFSLSLKFSKG